MTTVQQNNNPQIFSFLRQEKLTNVTLTADGKMVKAHKLILAAASKYFEVNNIDEQQVMLILLIIVIISSTGFVCIARR